jgi:hypothetical protein
MGSCKPCHLNEGNGSSSMAYDAILDFHQEWLGYARPQGLVVSLAALKSAQLSVDRGLLPEVQRKLLAVLGEGETPEIPNFLVFASQFLEWPLDRLAGAPAGPALDAALTVNLTELNDSLQPSYALYDSTPGPRPLVLVKELAADVDPDFEPKEKSHGWQASAQARFERLLRETQVPIGILATGRLIRLVYAPRGESSGHITFQVSQMVLTAGRPLAGALQMLLHIRRFWSGDAKYRLPATLENSRKFQNQVSTDLAEQVLEALYELLRGFQSALHQPGGAALRQALADDPQQVYGGLLTVLMRTVFLLYAEDRNLLPSDPLFVQHYSVGGLFEKLREDAALHHDTMDGRYGAWGQLVAAFRMLYDGARHGEQIAIPARRGYLFDPARYPFLEGDEGALPRIPDGVIFRVLEKLLYLKGERLSYRTLDVEQIGSVYEVTMGFQLQIAEGVSVAVRPKKTHGAPVTVNLEKLLAVKSGERAKWLAQESVQKLTGTEEKALRAASTIADAVAALGKKVAAGVTPSPVPAGAMVFQPSPERRLSGSNYTPRALTEPIVRHTLAPVLAKLGPKPTADQILALKVCDPAMGSGAFLVEACRQLGAALAEAWQTHGETPAIPPDEDVQLLAQRTVAQRCLYGVDRNKMAADLAKLSLWLATLAKDHPFTFLDHALRDGDSLVGFGVNEISWFSWEGDQESRGYRQRLREDLELALRNRAIILNAPDTVPYEVRRQQLDVVDEKLENARLAGDCLVAAFFSGARQQERKILAQTLDRFMAPGVDLGAYEVLQSTVRALRGRGVRPFHWELEYPEVFRQGGFDAIVGNPPFAGKNTLLAANPEGYLDWLKHVHPESHGNADLVAHFFRRSFTLLKPDGCFGLIATNTIGQGDTRSTGLRWICLHGGTIYRAKKRLKWPGEAAVVVSVVHVVRGEFAGPPVLDDREVPKITAYLFYEGGHEDPAALKANEDKSFQGSIILGMGFTFDDTDKKGQASSLADMLRLIAADSANQERIFPYLGGEEINDSPTHAHHRYVINFEDFPLRREELGESWLKASETSKRDWLRSGAVPIDYPDPVAQDWPALLEIVRERVKPERNNQKRDSNRDNWWHYAEKRPGLMRALRRIDACFALSRVSPHLAVTRLPAKVVAADTIVVFPLLRYSPFAVLQSRVHEVWARFMASTLEDRLRYTPSDCFETFPFPVNYEASERLAAVGETYYNYRAELMVKTNKGLTKTYNRFHDPEDQKPDIRKLRELHAELDTAVLEAFGWSDLAEPCDFEPEFADEEGDDASAADDQKKPKKKKFRLRWRDEIRDKLLARLLELNRQRAAEQGTPLPTPEPDEPASKTKKKPEAQERLF